MSHFTKVELELRDAACIKGALEDMGFTVETGSVTIKGYAGNKQDDIVVRKSQLPSGCYGDMGFRLNKTTGKYDLVCDEMDLNAGKLRLGELKQGYGVRKVRMAAKRQGFRVVRESRNKGKVQILLRR